MNIGIFLMIESFCGMTYLAVLFRTQRNEAYRYAAKLKAALLEANGLCREDESIHTDGYPDRRTSHEQMRDALLKEAQREERTGRADNGK